jgi:hypothetical protein
VLVGFAVSAEAQQAVHIFTTVFHMAKPDSALHTEEVC